MNKKNNKLTLNKQIVANLNGQDMEGVKGGAIFTLNQWCPLLYELATKVIEMTCKECFSGDARGICETDLCYSNACTQPSGITCYGGSACAKCG